MTLRGVIAVLAAVAAASLSAFALCLARSHFFDGGGLSAPMAWAALAFGGITGCAALFSTRRPAAALSIDWGRLSPWTWLAFFAFACFALRSFCWLMYVDYGKIDILLWNNIGDLSRHLLYARYFACGTPWWPEHPLDAWAKLRYYPGIDLFQSLLLLAGADEMRALVWVGLFGSAATALALWRWGGAFTLAGFLFSGGLAGYQIFLTHVWEDYQSNLAWKNLALAIFVTQRGFLFALPAGLLLLAHWREKLFPAEPARADGTPPAGPTGLLPFWLEALLYIALPFFQLYAFAALSLWLGSWLVLYWRDTALRWHLLKLIGIAFIPASFEVALMTNGFSSGHSFLPKPGWMQESQPFLSFWMINFGLMAPLAAALWLWTAARPVARFTRGTPSPAIDAAEAFVLPAGLLFLVTCFVMLAPWDWDNTKVMLWCYLTTLPFLYERWIGRWSWCIRWPVCGALFLSGFICVAAAIGPNATGYTLARRFELESVRFAVRHIPVAERFACAPAYNHPLVLCGRKIAMGYAGALYGYGLDYAELEKTLDTLFRGGPEWRQAAEKLGVRYVFWGSREAERYPDSPRPWEGQCPAVAQGKWGKIYDLGTTNGPVPAAAGPR